MERSITTEKIGIYQKKDEFFRYLREKSRTFPWWLMGILIITIATILSIAAKNSYRNAFDFIKAGILVTILTTMFAFIIALVLGLITGLGRISNNVLVRNIATFYVEVVRGIPMLVLIFFIAFVGVPALFDGLHAFGEHLLEIGLVSAGSKFSQLENSMVTMNTRAVIALAVTYGAFLAEIFRAGIESIGRGQMEAARAQGMTYWQAMRYVILPQAIRNVLPALGNDFISMLKDSSLVSVLAVRDITQIARLYAGRTFQYREAYLTLAVLYLAMTVLLSLLLKSIERRMNSDVQS